MHSPTVYFRQPLAVRATPHPARHSGSGVAERGAASAWRPPANPSFARLLSCAGDAWAGDPVEPACQPPLKQRADFRNRNVAFSLLFSHRFCRKPASTFRRDALMPLGCPQEISAAVASGIGLVGHGDAEMPA